MFRKTRLLIILFTFGLFFNSCSSTRSSIATQDTQLAAFDREDYSLLPQVEGKASSTRIWFLFIPIGGKSDEKMERKAYRKAVEMIDNADGLLETRYEHKKIVIPLIVVTPVIKRTKAVGRGYRLKSDEEIRKSRTNN